MNVWFPRPLRPWIIDLMLDRKTMPAYLCGDLFKPKNHLTRTLLLALSAVITPLALYIIRQTEPICARKGKDAQLTIDDSVKSLLAGEDNVIFPEDPTLEPLDGGCVELQTGFLHVGQAYQQKGGRALAFYPVAICPSDRSMRVGAPLRFDPNRSFYEQKLFIAKRLRTDIVDLMTDK